MQESHRRGGDTASLHKLHIPKNSFVPFDEMCGTRPAPGPSHPCGSGRCLWHHASASLGRTPKEWRETLCLFPCFAWVKSEMRSYGKQIRGRKIKTQKALERFFANTPSQRNRKRQQKDGRSNTGASEGAGELAKQEGWKAVLILLQGLVVLLCFIFLMLAFAQP